jgi:hypothetical protein
MKVLCVAKRKLADHFQNIHDIANVALLLFSCTILHCLSLSLSLSSCNNKRVVYGAIVQHIIGEGHCRRVARIYRDKESITYSKQQNEEQDDASEKNDGECDETAVDDGTEQVEVPALPDTDSFAGRKSAAKKSTPKSKAAKKKKATKGGNRRNNNALTIEGGLVVNGLDIVRYIRGLEGRISELESKLAEASSASASAPTVV